MKEDYQEVLHQPPKVLIGKNGITPGVIDHIVAKMKHQKMMKVKVHKEAVEEHGMDHFITEIFKFTKLYVLDVRGHTVILSKKKVEDKFFPQKYRDLREQARLEKKKIRDAKNNGEQKPPTKGKKSDSDSNYDYIDYDDEKLLEKIDETSDEIYGVASNPNPAAQAKIEEKRPVRKVVKTPQGKAKPFKKSTRPKRSDSRRTNTSRSKKIQRAGIRKGKPGYSKSSKKGSKGKSRSSGSRR